MKDIFVLLDAIHEAYSRPEYTPKNGVTYCNQFVNEVCKKFGFAEFEGRLANEIVDIVSSNPQWARVDMEQAQILANGGSLVIAGAKGPIHGHVNVICPGREKISGKWGQVPSCANVGSENSIGRGVNWCFRDRPEFWAYRRSI